MPDDLVPRVDLLERLQAQQETLNALLITMTERLGRNEALHSSTLRRHGEMLDAHETSRLQHETHVAEMRALTARQQHLEFELHAMMAGLLTRQDDQTARLERHAERLAQHEETMAALRQILAAVTDMLDRGNGH